jgi:DNA helicase II / ATP-dependent DNA helicase PcrA
MAWDDDLSPEQRELAAHQARVVRLVAGPGTGKTRVMTRRVAYLIEVEGVNPSAILALTFSRAAAQELRERLEQLLGSETGDRPGVYTLHAFALRQLLRLGGAPGLPKPIRIADDYDEGAVIEKELKVLTDTTVRDIRKEIADLASDWETLDADKEEWEQRYPNPRFLAAWRQHREVYGYTLRAELVYSLKKALDEDPDLELDPAFTHVLVDEYQDLNRCEIAVLQRLDGGVRRFFAAGDDDQSIYGFRNAFPLGLREFSESHPGAVDEELVECHRCDRDILAMGLNVAEQDVERIPKELRPLETAEDGVVTAHSYPDISAEARGIADICRRLVDEDDLAPGQILILLRNDPNGIYSAPIIRELSDRGLDAELPTNPFAVLDQAEGRRLVCVLRLLRDREDGLAWRELLELRDNGLGVTSFMAVYKLAVDRGERFHETLQVIAGDPDALDHQRRNRIAEEVVVLNGVLDDAADLLEQEADPALEAALDIAGLRDGDLREEITRVLQGLVVDTDDPTLGDIEESLHSTRGGWDDEEREEAEQRVQIMTMHTAKGLTADAVIVAACDDELVPGKTENQRELDDQRRLLYVSLTRPRHFLAITFARERRGQQSHRLQVSERRRFTRFLRDYVELASF